MTRHDFRELFRSGWDPLLTILGKKVPRDITQDLAQDSFLIAWEKHREIHPPGYKYLHGIGLRVIARHVRKLNCEMQFKRDLMVERGPIWERLDTLVQWRNRHKRRAARMQRSGGNHV